MLAHIILCISISQQTTSPIKILFFYRTSIILLHFYFNFDIYISIFLIISYFSFDFYFFSLLRSSCYLSMQIILGYCLFFVILLFFFFVGLFFVKLRFIFNFKMPIFVIFLILCIPAIAYSIKNHPKSIKFSIIYINPIKSINKSLIYLLY